MTELTSVGFEPAAGFPAAAHDSTHLRLAPFAQTPQNSTWRHFGLGWNAVAYRYQACAEHDETFRSDFARHGGNVGGWDRYRQQRDLYGSFVNGCSAIESFFYAAFAAGALKDPTVFRIVSRKQQRDVSLPRRCAPSRPHTLATVSQRFLRRS